MERPLLFEKYRELWGKVDWIPLGEYPTPVEKMEGLSNAEGLRDFYIKRDDKSSPDYGGNKVRKLEFLLAHARSRGHRTLLTFGAVGSNHILATVIHGEKIGMKVVAVMMPQPNAAYVRKNLLLDYVHGATFAIASSPATIPLAFLQGIRSGFDPLRKKFPYIIAPGGSSPRSSLGHVDAAFELKKQVDAGLLPEPEFIFVTLGSSGTAAGLMLGARLAGLGSRIVPVRVVERPICNRYILALHVKMAGRFLHARCPDIPVPKLNPRDIILVNDFCGRCYAAFTREGMEAVEKAKRLDAVKLDGTYTGKTLAGALDFIHQNGLERRKCLFWNSFNSADLYPAVQDVDYRCLPTKLHKYFEGPLQEEEMGCEVVY